MVSLFSASNPFLDSEYISRKAMHKEPPNVLLTSAITFLELWVRPTGNHPWSACLYTFNLTKFSRSTVSSSNVSPLRCLLHYTFLMHFFWPGHALTLRTKPWFRVPRGAPVCLRAWFDLSILSPTSNFHKLHLIFPNIHVQRYTIIYIKI